MNVKHVFIERYDTNTYRVIKVYSVDGIDVHEVASMPLSFKDAIAEARKYRPN